ncbi:MAG: DEAD/DEAH box helicase [Ruminococcus sp.]|nr:DEAD/DEAH box helicase [Ruminococcus sp.]
MSEKFDRGQIKRLIKQARDTDEGYKKLIESESSQVLAVRQAAQGLYNDRLRATLEAMDTEHLAKGKQGIRVSLLVDAGIKNIWQLSRMTSARIESIKGVGAQSALKITETVKQIVENTKENLRVRINADNPNKADTDIVRALYVYLRCKPLREKARSLYEANHKPLMAELESAKKAGSGLSWLFTSKAKKAMAQQAADSLALRLSGEFGSTALFSQYNSIVTAPRETYMADFLLNSAEYYSALEQAGQGLGVPQNGDMGLPAQLVREVEAHQLDLRYLKATLRSYQTFGTKYIVHQKRTLLGDEMGLGKTVQAIAAMAALKAEGVTHFMVVCPASVLINWCREIEKHSTLSVTKVHGSDDEALLHWRKNGDVAVTTYESVSRFTMPEKFRIGMIIADEAHYVKNPDTQRTKALSALLRQTENILFMSGTPLENRVDEMCFLCSLLQPAVAQELERVKYISTAEQFRQELAPVYLRRTREDVLTELPDLIEKEQWCVMSDKEKLAYRESVLSGNFMAIRQVSWQMPDVRESCKAQRLLELCDKAKDENRKVIVFSFFRETLDKVQWLLADRCMEVITGAVSPLRRQEIVDEFTEAEAGAVLISQVQAGGTGLNIQSASVIIFCEPQIKPSIENQAISRAYRMGQVRDVMVHRLLCDETIDERMLEILRNKQIEFDNFADESVVGEEGLASEQSSSESWITKMVREEQQRLSAQ